MDIRTYINKMKWTTQQYAIFAGISVSQAWAHRHLFQKPHKKFVLKLNLLTKGEITQEDVDASYNNREKHMKSKMSKKPAKMKKVMKEFKKSTLHSGSKKGPLVKSRKQAIAIGLSEARKAGEKVAKKKSS